MPEAAGYLSVNGAQIHYQETGQGDPLVFVHAGVADLRMWEDQAAFFSSAYRVIRFDLRGFGGTKPVPGPFSYSADIAGVMDCLAVQRASLIGCSMGGMACMDFTLEHPDRVDALVMVGSAPTGLELDVPRPAKFAEAEAAEERGDWESLIELSAQIWYDGEGRSPQDVDPRRRELMKQMQREALPYRAAQQGQPVPMKPTAAERLADLRLPLLLVCGTHDTPYILAASHYMEEHVRGAQLVMMDSAHLPSMDRPDEFNGIVHTFLLNTLKPG